MKQESVVGSYGFQQSDVDLIEMQYLLLSEKETENNLLQFLNILFSKSYSYEERKERLEKLGFVMEEHSMVSREIRQMTAEEICYYDSRFRAGWEDGLEKGREEGREEGREKGRMDILFSLVQQGRMSISEAASFSGKTEEGFLREMAGAADFSKNGK